MFIPLAAHKNELVVIDGMDAFSHYFCLATKQKMTPLATETGISHEAEDEEEKEFFSEAAETGEDDDTL